MDNSEHSEWPPLLSPSTPTSQFLAVATRESDSMLATVRPFANFGDSQAVDTDEKINVEKVSCDHSTEAPQNAEDATPVFRRMSTSLPNIAFCRCPDAVQEDVHTMAQNEGWLAPAEVMLTEEADLRVNDPEFAYQPEYNSLNAEALPSSLPPLQNELRRSRYPLFVMVAPNEIPADCLHDVVLVEVSDYERWIMCFALPLGVYTTRVSRNPPRGLILEHWPNVDEVAQELKMRQYKLKRPPVPTVALDRFAFHQFIVSRPPACVRGHQTFEEAPRSGGSEMARQLERHFGLDEASRLIPMNLGGHFPAYLRLSPWQPVQRLTQNSSPASNVTSNSSSRTAKAPGGTRLSNQRSRSRGLPGGQQREEFSCSTYIDNGSRWSPPATPNPNRAVEARPTQQSLLYPRDPTFQPPHNWQNTKVTHRQSRRSGRLPSSNSLAEMADNRGRALAAQRQTSSGLTWQSTSGAYGNQQPHHVGQRAPQPQSSRPDPVQSASRGGVLEGTRKRTVGWADLSQPPHAQEHSGRVVAPSARSNAYESHHRGGVAAPRTQSPQAPRQSPARQRTQSLQRTATENNNQHSRPISSMHATDGAYRNQDPQWQSVRQRSYGPRPAAAGYDTRGRVPAPAQYPSEARLVPSRDAASRYQQPQARGHPAQHSFQRSQNTHFEDQYDSIQNSRPTVPRPADDGMRRYDQPQSGMARSPHGIDNRYEDGRCATHRTTQPQPGNPRGIESKRISTDSGFGAYDDWTV